MHLWVFLLVCALVFGNDVIEVKFDLDPDFATIDLEQGDWESHLQLSSSSHGTQQWKAIRVTNVPKQSGGVVTLDFKPSAGGPPVTYEAIGNNGVTVIAISMQHKGHFVTPDGELDPTEPLCGIEKIGDLLTGRRSEVTGDIAVKLAIKLCGKFGFRHMSLYDQSFYACGGPDHNDYSMGTAAMYAVKGATTYYMRNHFYPCQLAETGYEPEALQFCAALYHLHHVTIADYGKGQCADRYPLVAESAFLTSTFEFKNCVDSGAKLSWCLKAILEEGVCEKKFAFFDTFLGQGHSFVPCPIADSLGVIGQVKGYCAQLVPEPDATEFESEEVSGKLRIRPVHFCSRFTESELLEALGTDSLTEADPSLLAEPDKLIAPPTVTSEQQRTEEEAVDTKEAKSAKAKGHRSFWGSKLLKKVLHHAKSYTHKLFANVE